jgi:hypothetical protein
MTITEKIKNFDDVLNHHNIQKEDFEKKVENLTADEKAYQQIKLIASALNEGWVPDWQNDDQWKYYPWFYMDDSSAPGRFSFYGSGTLGSGSGVGSRLCFKSEELSDYAAEQFTDIYREYFVVE